MLRINAKTLVNSEEFVREPVDEKVNEILTSSSKKIILTGGKSVGKSTVLYSLEKRGLGSKEQTIYYCPEKAIVLRKEPNENYSNELFDYLYELQFTNNILIYIKNNYPILFENKFKKDKELVEKYLKELYNQITNSLYGDANFDIKFSTKDLSFAILSRFYDKMGIKKLNLAIDGFDKANGSSKYVQGLYQKYFDMFDKVILTSDDPNLDSKKLRRKRYELKEISYGKDKDVLREIIRRRKSLYDDDMAYKELYTTDLFLNKLTTLDGNIDLSLESLVYFRELLKWYNVSVGLERFLDEAIEDKKDYSKKLEKMISKPTLYL